jgi:hypothetical protein
MITFKTGIEWYPFSPYRMFSKNWENNIVMERIRYRSVKEDSYLFPWQIMGIPFFQANQISFNIFLDLEVKDAKDKLCDLFPLPGLLVLREEVKYSLVGPKMVETIQKQEIVHECNK